MASMVSFLRIAAATVSTLASAGAASAMSLPPSAPELRADQVTVYRARIQGTTAMTPPAEAAPRSATGEALVEWSQLQNASLLDFGRINRFLMANPGWPGEERLRKLAENAVPLDGADHNAVIAFTNRFPPLTASGHVRRALAFHALRQPDAARAAARDAWTTGALSELEEARLLSVLPDALSPAEHDRRMNLLLARGAVRGAERTLPLTSAAKRPVFAARLSLRARKPDAAALASAVEAAQPALLRTDAGYIADKATWLRASGQSQAARALLAAPRMLAAAPTDPADWYATLLTNARAAQADGQYETAFQIARQLNDGLPAGTVVRDQPIDIRDDYTTLAWMAGNLAMRQLHNPRAAVDMFRAYGDAARSPQTQTKGWYWAARAADRAGDHATAKDLWQRASVHSDQFYGQLSRERMGMEQPRPAPMPVVPVTSAQVRAFQDSAIVRATRALGEMGLRREQTLFIRQLAQNARSDADHYLGGRLAEAIGRQDLGVMMGRSARINGVDDYDRASFPNVSVPVGHESNWTMIHAIIRQESQFDRTAVSHAGARGLMQLMPGTAREVSVKLGRPYDAPALTVDTQYNMLLGSTYFQQMLNSFGGSYPLAVAAYNAGPGNVRKWLNSIGDPRTGSIDVVDWIEAIPLSETRGYVQRVLENAVVYDTLHPDPSKRWPKAPLSHYLGKRTPG